MTHPGLPTRRLQYTAALVFVVMLPVIGLGGCSTAFVRPSDSACNQDLAQIKALTQTLQSSVNRNSAPAERKPTLAALADAADHARASCGPATAPFGLHLGSSNADDSPGAQRARDPKNGGGF